GRSTSSENDSLIPRSPVVGASRQEHSWRSDMSRSCRGSGDTAQEASWLRVSGFQTGEHALFGSRGTAFDWNAAHADPSAHVPESTSVVPPALPGARPGTVATHRRFQVRGEGDTTS